MDFFTATINNWKSLLAPDKYKQLIIDSLKWMHNEQRAVTHGFIIMPNHIHLLWSAMKNFEGPENESTLLSYTAHGLKKDLQENHPAVLKHFLSTQSDRKFHFRERRSNTINIVSRKIAEQKLGYIHDNPLQEKWNLVEKPEDYYYSSSRFYLTNKDDFGFLAHYMDYIW